MVPFGAESPTCPWHGTAPGVRRGRAVPLPPSPRVASPRLHVWKGTPRAWHGAWGRQSHRERGHRGQQPGLGEGRGRAGWAGSPVPVAGPSAAWCAARGGRAQLHRDENSKCGRVAREQLPWERAEEEFSHSEGASWGKIQEFSAAVEERKALQGDGERWGELAPVAAVRAGPFGHCLGCSNQARGVPVSPAPCWGWAPQLLRWGWGLGAQGQAQEGHKKGSASPSGALTPKTRGPTSLSVSLQARSSVCPMCCCRATGKCPAGDVPNPIQGPRGPRLSLMEGCWGGTEHPGPCPEPWGCGGSAAHTIFRGEGCSQLLPGQQLLLRPTMWLGERSPACLPPPPPWGRQLPAPGAGGAGGRAPTARGVPAAHPLPSA